MVSSLVTVGSSYLLFWSSPKPTRIEAIQQVFLLVDKGELTTGPAGSMEVGQGITYNVRCFGSIESNCDLDFLQTQIEGRPTSILPQVVDGLVGKQADYPG